MDVYKKKEKMNKKNSIFNFKKLNHFVEFNKKNIGLNIENNFTFTDLFEGFKLKTH